MKIIFESFGELDEYMRRVSGEGQEKPKEKAVKHVAPTMAPPSAREVATVQAAPVAPAVPAQAAPVQAAPAAPAAQTAPVAPARPSAPSVPTAAASYTLDDLSRAAMTLMDAERQADLVALLGQFGVATLPDLPAAQYGAFATALRGMGAKI